MAKLTQQDLDNFNKLTEALEKLKTPDPNSDPIIKFVKERIIKSVKNTEELSEIVNPLYSYWKVLSAVGKQIQFSPTSFEQKFSDAIENLKRSLQVVEDEKVDLTDEIEELQTDSLFFGLLKKQDPRFQEWTQKLIDDRDPNLNENEIKQLTDAWGTAVQKFVEDARKEGESCDKVTPGKPETFASFFRIHNELEKLYSELADTETVQASR